MRTINADELKANLHKWFPQYTLEGIEAKTLFAQILADIDNTPTVYPICEDKACKYRANERPQGVEACSQCEFSSTQGWEMPCKECMHAYEDRFLRADIKGGAEK